MTDTYETHFLEMWQGQDELVFQAANSFRFNYIERHEEVYKIYDFQGKTARVLVVTCDLSLDRIDALKIANCFMKNTFVEYRFDLDRCAVFTVEPIPPETPQL
jgi:hypothetical protein